MKKIDFFKKVVGYVVGAGTAKIISGVITKNVVPKGNLDKFVIVVATFAISGMACEIVKQYTDEKIDQFIEEYRNLVDDINQSM